MRRLRRADAARQELNKLRERFVRPLLPFVISIAGRYQRSGLALCDLVQVGNTGLLEAVERFDYRRGAMLSTFARWWIRSAILDYLREQGRTIRLRGNKVTALVGLRRARMSLVKTLGRDPTSAELAEALRMTEAQVTALLRHDLPVTSLDLSGPPDGQVEEDNGFAEAIADPLDERPEDALNAVELARKLEEALTCLTPRERQVIKLRFGWDHNGALTLRQVGRRLGLVHERARQIEKEALSKLLRANPGLEAFLDGR
jgi:RNA polymerase primary sigma factor